MKYIIIKNLMLILIVKSSRIEERLNNYEFFFIFKNVFKKTLKLKTICIDFSSILSHSRIHNFVTINGRQVVVPDKNSAQCLKAELYINKSGVKDRESVKLRVTEKSMCRL